MEQASIRRAGKDDFNNIFALLPQLWPDKELNRGRLKTVFERALEAQHDIHLIAESGQAVIGFCSLTIRSSLWLESCIGYISEMIVEQSLRRKGVGTALLQTAANIACDHGCKRLELESAFHRNDAHEFYEKLGFKKRAYHFSKVL